MADKPDYDYKHLKAKYGKQEAIKRVLDIIKRRHPPKRERIVIP
ncbi:hypothetical protein LCGC14_1305690 [marine sediment metagenome]|uniref:Uncharacterized protein n=1 Tax=marine sediment metagenome TaxID=412755 RepID=A0A0F9L8Q8_9ZZZZ